MQFTMSVNRDLAKIARNPGKAVHFRTRQNHSTSVIAVTSTLTIIAALGTAIARLSTRYRRNPQQLMRPVITTLDKSERLLDKAASGLKGQVEELDLSPQLKQEVEQGIDQINEHLHQATTIAKQNARRLESAGSSNGRPSTPGRPFGTTAHDS